MVAFRTVFLTVFMVLAALVGVSSTSVANDEQRAMKRILVVSSYHREYLWSQSTQDGLVNAMIDLGYLDNKAQAEVFTRTDETQSSRVHVIKMWMDTKRRNTSSDIARETARITDRIDSFRPDLVMLGDDNAANYIGNRLLDTETPVVFWGINGLPLKYGLVDSMDQPGHNVTGVWQQGYHKESLEYLQRLRPDLKTFAILACDSATAQANVKQIRYLAQRGMLPMEMKDIVVTSSASTFKQRALELQDKVDAFFVLNHDTLVNDHGEHVDMMEIGRWYLENIRIPEVSHEDQFVREGMLLTANDSGFNQGYRAFEMAYDILEQGHDPAMVRTVTPQRGPVMVNRQRAAMLGISIAGRDDIIDIYVEEALALQ